MSRVGEEHRNVSYALHETNPIDSLLCTGITEVERDSMTIFPDAHEEKGGPENLNDSSTIT